MNILISMLLVLVVLAAYEFGSVRGYRRGHAVGVDRGWNEREIKRLNDEHRRNYARRGRDGKFNGGSR